MTLTISRHRILNLLADAVLIAVAWRLTFWIRFDQAIPPFYRHLLSWQIYALVVGITIGFAFPVAMRLSMMKPARPTLLQESSESKAPCKR